MKGGGACHVPCMEGGRTPHVLSQHCITPSFKAWLVSYTHLRAHET